MKQIHVALVGFGNVGRAFAEYCRTNHDNLSPRISIRAVADSSGGLVIDSDKNLDRVLAHKAHQRSVGEFSPSEVTDATKFITSIANSGVSVLVESLPTNISNADTSLADVSRRGIDADTEALIKTARANGKAVRLVGRALQQNGQLRVTVAPEMIAADSPFFSVRGTSKLAVFKTMTREISGSSRSGRDAISQTIMNDVVRVCSAM